MHASSHKGTKFRLQRKTLGFNFNKLQAVACLASCAVLSIGLIAWGAKAFI
ncbi:MAG: hypothetical protein JWQ23_2973 [Herminiimonas sp.]|nr:hypothetical protein [Herminiimonas sp.]